MTYPYKMNLLDIIIKQTSASANYIDPVFGDTSGPVQFSDPITLTGQANFGAFKTFEDLDRNRTGDGRSSFVTVTFEQLYLTDNSITLAKGDVVISVAGQVTDLEITKLQPKAPLNGAFLLLEVQLMQRVASNKSK